MLRIARKHNKNRLVKFEIGDATCLRFEQNSFDVSSISFALHDMPLCISEQVLQEIARVTRVNGMIIIVDYDLPNNKMIRTLTYHAIALYESRYYRQFIASDLEALLRKTRIEILAEIELFLGNQGASQIAARKATSHEEGNT